MDDSIDLTISIGSLGDWDRLEECLRSIYEEDCERLKYEIWVVVNAAGKTSVPDLIALRFPDVHVLRYDGALGFCRTHNAVLATAQGRYALILDDDTVVPKGTLAGMVAFMDAHPRVGMSGCRTENPDGSFQKSFALMPSFRTEIVNIFTPGAFWPEGIYRDLAAARDVDWLNGSFMLVRREVMRSVGVLDEHYYTYVCEADWCLRIRRAGWQVTFVPQFAITHVGGEHSINTSNKRSSQIVRAHVNRFYFFRKHYGAAAAALLRPIMALGALQRIMFYGWRYAVSRSDRNRASGRIRGFARVLALSLSAKPHVMRPAWEERTVSRQVSVA